MRSKKLLLDILDHVEAYENQLHMGEEPNFGSFLHFCNQTGSVVSERKVAGDKEKEVVERGMTTETSIARLLSLLYRYAKSYIRKALDGSPLQTPEEFSYLVVLMTYDSLSKTELIQKNIMEKTSGMEVIKRLLKQGLMEQEKDPQDKRSIRLKITESGRRELFRLFPQMEMASTLVAGNLSMVERKTLLHLLIKLDHFHHPLFLNEKNTDLDVLTQQVIGSGEVG